MKNFVAFLCCVIVALLFGFTIYARFTNPQLTETELFLKYWDSWTLGILVLCSNGLIYKRLESNA